jgi:hypothetical protein
LLIAFAVSLGGLLAVLRTAQSFGEHMLEEAPVPKREAVAAAPSSAAPKAGGKVE